MKQLMFTLLLLAGISTAAVAQSSFVIAPPNVQTLAPADDTDVEIHTDVFNMTNSQISLNWQRLTIQIGQGCKTQVCDPVACFADWISTHTFNLAAQDTAQLIVHLINNTGNLCCAIIHLKVTNVAIPSDTSTAVYLFNCLSGTEGALPEANVKLFPNPVTDQFQLDNADAVSHIRIYDLAGRLVEYVKTTPGAPVNIAHYTPGTYILGLEDDNGNVFQAMEIKKN